MQYTQFRLLLFIIIYTQCKDCEKYLGKFNTLSNDGRGVSKLQFHGGVFYQEETNIYDIYAIFIDPLLFDREYFGLVKENGVLANKTCFQLKVWKYSSADYSDPQQLTDLNITGTQNLAKKQQILEFKFPKSELNQRTIKTENSNNFVYFGYYSFSFYQSETNQHQYSFYFYFTITIDKFSDSHIENAFFSLNYQETTNCQPEALCYAVPSSELLWCSDFTCQQYIDPEWYNNGRYYLKQKIIGAGMENYFLNFTTVYFIGNGFSVNVTPIAIQNDIQGETIIEFQASIVWDNITIIVTSYLNSEELWQGDPVNGWTQINQIPFFPNVTNVTCEEECVANNFSKVGCQYCNFMDLGQFIQNAALIGLLFWLQI